MRLAVFDCDGTLVDGQADVCWAMDRAFARAGLAAPDPQAVRRIVGLSLPAAVRALAPDLSEDQNAAVTEFYRSSFRARREEGLLDEPLYDGIADLLTALHGAGWQLAVPQASPTGASLPASPPTASPICSSRSRPPTATPPSPTRQCWRPRCSRPGPSGIRR